MSDYELTQIKDSIEKESKFIQDIHDSMQKIIIGQDDLIEKLLLAILSDGHVLLEGVPGLAKTLTIKSLAQIIDTKFQRLQFTPDLLPAGNELRTRRTGLSPRSPRSKRVLC